MSDGAKEGGPQARKSSSKTGHEDTTTEAGSAATQSKLNLDKLCKICVIILLGVEVTGSDVLLLV